MEPLGRQEKADNEIFEIAAVRHDFRLIDAESYQRKYCTSQGNPLERSYYVVTWPDHIDKVMGVACGND